MKQSTEKPPNWEAIKKFFPEVDSPNWKPIFCYGDTIYNPTKQDLANRPDLIVHEEVHMKQQGKSPDFWWERYFLNPEFRLEQEVEAYRAQYKYMSKHIKDRETLAWFLSEISRDLSSELYGNIISKQDAWSRIRSVV